MLDFITRKFDRSEPYTPIPRDIFRAYNKHRPGGARDLICYVPFNSLTFSWQGRVYACTYNRNILVGQYPKDSIRDIWFGKPIRRLRGYLQHNDLSYGCQHCKYFVEKEKFTGLKPQGFDKYSDYKKFEYPRVMEFETSNQCNLECIMCNGNTSSSIRQNRDHLPALPEVYDDAFIAQLEEFVPHLREARFLGGEPFLIRSYFQIWERIISVDPSVSISVVTNGTILTDKVKDLLTRGNFELTISIDSIRRERFEHIRRNADYDTVMANLAYFNDYARSRGKSLSLSFTTQRENWDELPQVIEFCNERGITFFNSFLTSPFDLSVIFLPSDELQHMHDYLAAFTLPVSNEIERYNHSVFQDYLRYLRYYETKNRNGIDTSEQKDNYTDPIAAERQVSGFHTRSELYDRIRTVQQGRGSLVTHEEVIMKLDALFDSLPDSDIERRILIDAASSPLEILWRDVSRMTTSELRDRVIQQFSH